MLEQQLDTIIYHVRAGDSLSRIISNYYGSVSLQKRQAIVAQIQNDNPKVTNPHQIMPNQLLLIDILRGSLRRKTYPAFEHKQKTA